MRGSPREPSSFHQPGIGGGIGNTDASVRWVCCCICCMSSQLQNNTATATASANWTRRIDFIERRILTRFSLGCAIVNIAGLFPSQAGSDLVDGVHEEKYARSMATLTTNASPSTKE